MVSRAPFATLLLSLFALCSIVGAQNLSDGASSASLIAGVQGKVLGADGRPVPGIHVELDDPSTAIPVISTYTQPDGTFELYNIPQGNYEVIAESSDSEVSRPVSVQTGRPTLELHFPGSDSGASSPEATVSVARMLVPSRALRMYRQALKDFNADKFDEAAKQLDGALQIDPEYADALTLRGLIQLREPDISAGRQTLERALQIDPSETAAYIALAAVYNHEGRFDDAMHISEKGLSLAPRTWQAYLEMAKASIAKSMYQRGLKFIRQAERLGGNTYAEVHLVKAYALMPLKLYKEAKYELQASLARKHDDNLANQAQHMLAQLEDLETPASIAQR